jgi:hypothetical protein
MRIARTIAIAGLLILPAVAHGQHTKAAASGRVAGIAPAPVIVAPIVAPGRFLTGGVPIIISPDGRVFANFGAGFEQIVTACGSSNGIVVTNAQSGGLVQPTVLQPTVSQPGIVVEPLPFTPAVPNQQTASQQMLGQSSVPVQTQQQVVVGNRACWSTDGRGQVFVGRQ